MDSKRGRAAGRSMLVLVMATFLMASGSLPAMAGGSAKAAVWQTRGMERHKHYRSVLSIWQDPQLVQKLELTEEQVNKLRDAYFASREKRLELKAQLDRLGLEVDKVFSAETVDQEAVRRLARKIPDLKGDLYIQVIESCLSLGKILNTNQIDKLIQFSLPQKKQIPKAGRKGDARDHSV